ncbi:MAG: hypothetical protein KatS3mg102_1077 [Planctomycetota bacterium]|nr:MAG: hypothetical protein KatS3mg102_1077 [Planctomycetota bacterium]
MAHQAGQPHEGIDLLRFFIGVMALLTVFVAGFAAIKFAEAESLRQAVAREEVNYANLRRVASSREFLEAVAREAAMQGQVDTETKDLGQFLQEVAGAIGLRLDNFRPEGGGSTGPGRRFLKKSIQFTIERQPLAVITDYLWFLQAKWPGLKVEELTIREAPRRQNEPFMGWQATVLVSVFKAKEGASP